MVRDRGQREHRGLARAAVGVADEAEEGGEAVGERGLGGGARGAVGLFLIAWLVVGGWMGEDECRS